MFTINISGLKIGAVVDEANSKGLDYGYFCINIDFLLKVLHHRVYIARSSKHLQYRLNSLLSKNLNVNVLDWFHYNQREWIVFPTIE